MEMIKCIASLLRCRRQGVTHDYTRRSLGHDYCVMDVQQGGHVNRFSGWGPIEGSHIRDGDYLIIPSKGGTTRYQMDRVQYCNDPTDMWFAWGYFAPRQEGDVPCTRWRGHRGACRWRKEESNAEL